MKVFKYTMTKVYNVGAWGHHVETLHEGYVVASSVEDAMSKISARFSHIDNVTVTITETDFIDIK